MPTAVITGASRGIGLEFARQLLGDGWHVHAGARRPEAAGGLAALATDRLVVHRLDVAERCHIRTLASSLAGEPVDLLVNNAGIWHGKAELHRRFDDGMWMEEFRVHVFAVMAMSEALVDNVAASRRRTIANISSGNGSFAWPGTSPDYPYNSTKAALNMLARGLAVDLAPKGIIVVNLSPGFVATDMTDHASDLEPAASVAGMRRVIAGLDISQSGAFRRYTGETMPW